MRVNGVRSEFGYPVYPSNLALICNRCIETGMIDLGRRSVIAVDRPPGVYSGHAVIWLGDGLVVAQLSPRYV
jgi:hypothetical protein